MKASGIAIGVVSIEPLAYVTAVEFYAPKPKKGQRVEALRRFGWVRDHVEAAFLNVGSIYPPSAVLVENPVGRRRVPTLVAAWGIAGAVAYEMAGEAAVTLSAAEWRKVLKLPTVKGDPKGPGIALAKSLGAPGHLGEDCLEAVAQAAAAARWLS